MSLLLVLLFLVLRRVRGQPVKNGTGKDGSPGTPRGHMSWWNRGSEETGRWLHKRLLEGGVAFFFFFRLRGTRTQPSPHAFFKQVSEHHSSRLAFRDLQEARNTHPSAVTVTRRDKGGLRAILVWYICCCYAYISNQRKIQRTQSNLPCNKTSNSSRCPNSPKQLTGPTPRTTSSSAISGGQSV
jgi:hypothetical protein